MTDKLALDKTYEELTEPFRKPNSVDVYHDSGWCILRGIKTHEPKKSSHTYHIFMYDHKDRFAGMRLDWEVSSESVSEFVAGEEALFDNHLAQLFTNHLKNDVLDGMYYLLRQHLRDNHDWTAFIDDVVDKEFENEDQ